VVTLIVVNIKYLTYLLDSLSQIIFTARHIACKHDICCARSFCLSVRPSVTLVQYVLNYLVAFLYFFTTSQYCVSSILTPNIVAEFIFLYLKNSQNGTVL